MINNLSKWVTHAQTFPLAFAQVREDPLVDHWIAERLPAKSRGLMIASGGCTAAALAAHRNFSSLHLVDSNASQIKLAQLKLAMLSQCSPAERLALLGHSPMVSDQRAAELTALGFCPELFGSVSEVAQLGPDYVGRYELLFAAFRSELASHREEIATLCELADTREQARRIDRTPLWTVVEDAFRKVMALPNLVALFGEGATQNPVMPFADHFVSRTRRALSTLPANTNPFLGQVFMGRFPSGAHHVWLELPVQQPRAALQFSKATMLDVLRYEDRFFHFIHLSNILDWLSVEEARELLDLAARRLVSGGWVVIRQMNSSLDIPALGGAIKFLPDEGKRLHHEDRSFFYQKLHIGRKT
jgi:S-adenosylmethionine-diacylglycerol 3-amino-3-carboxypropyl transferase